MKNPYFSGRPPGVYNFEGVDQNDRFLLTGQNTGNILFISALHKVISRETPTDHSRFVAAEIREKHDGLVIPAANWFNRSSDFGGLADRVEAVDLPVVMVGLGAQSYSQETYPQPTPGTLRLLKVVSERCHSISVRGEYSADALAHHGVKNVTVTGCPSMLWNGKPLEVTKPEKDVHRIALSSTRADMYEPVFLDDPSFAVSRMLSRLAYHKDIDYVAQTELADMQIAAGETVASLLDDRRREYLERLFEEKDGAAISTYLRRRLKAFFNVESWTSYLAGMDFTIGTRLHGVIASLLAGTPAALIVHDTRTREMARHLRIPCFEARDILESAEKTGLDFQRIYDSIDFSDFNAQQVAYFDDFMTFFKRNDVALTMSPTSQGSDPDRADRPGLAALNATKSPYG
jgi:hypothetical protein